MEADTFAKPINLGLEFINSRIYLVMELTPANYSSKNPTRAAELEAQEYSDSDSPPPSTNGSVIALAVASVPIIVLILIIVSFKICARVCPPGWVLFDRDEYSNYS